MIGFNRATATLVYLVAVLLLGGASSAGFQANLVIQVIGAVLIGLAYFQHNSGTSMHPNIKRFTLSIAVLALVQFLPLPPAIWQLLPGRAPIAHGFTLIGSDMPWLTLSLSPWKTLASLMWWLPAMAVFIAMRADGAPSSRNIILTITAVATVSSVLAAFQRVTGQGYIYQITNYGQGPGFFANSNHQGSFMLVALVLWGSHVAAAFAQTRGLYRSRLSAIGVPLALAVWLAFSVIISGSLACTALLLPVTLLLALVVRSDIHVPVGWLAIAALLVLASFATFLIYGPVANDLTAKGLIPGISRQEFLLTGLKPLWDFAPLGSGLGTFQEIYHWYENTSQISSTFVNHAHNDLLEILIETGIFGLVAIATFLWWFMSRALELWRSERDHAVALAASIAIGTELIHSLADYPLRTAALSTLMALCCALMVRPKESERSHTRTPQNKVGEEKRTMIRI